jgi:hypothetical protein
LLGHITPVKNAERISQGKLAWKPLAEASGVTPTAQTLAAPEPKKNPEQESESGLAGPPF